MEERLIDWLLDGDISIRYQVYRDLLDEDKPDLRHKIHLEGWAKQFLELQKPNGQWGMGWYRPKWACTHYIILILKYLQPIPEVKPVQDTINRCLDTQKSLDGGFSFWQNTKLSDVCVNGMVLNYATYFVKPDERLDSVIDLLLNVQMPDGGWNCRHLHGAVHSSFHTSLSVLEGLWEYRKQGGSHRLQELIVAEERALEFLLIHHLYLSHRTMEIVSPKMTLFSYPPHWKYDVLKALFHIAERGLAPDVRMHEALALLNAKRNQDGSWNLQNRHPGEMPFHMEKAGKPSRFNTLLALRVLKNYGETSI